MSSPSTMACNKDHIISFPAVGGHPDAPITKGIFSLRPPSKDLVREADVQRSSYDCDRGWQENIVSCPRRGLAGRKWEWFYIGALSWSVVKLPSELWPLLPNKKQELVTTKLAWLDNGTR
ncbi:hypothetical protein BDN72DRAFT_905324 [Pluteus cervinus]|uniref:Uncharacterized protein n=1 Tax=Pluteus cervinus TaxID=181527 RepID=A0ACD3A307_9AGAR|nr:hypothetical protein BDN72DRAFT_905324 [Pluteus cervinus]